MSTTDTEGDDERTRTRPFADFIREQRSGKTHDELSTLLCDVVEAVIEHRKQGSVTLKVTVTPLKEGTFNGAVSITDEVKASIPKADRGASMFFGDEEGNLHRDPPNQMRFEGLREVPGVGTVDTNTGEVRELANGTDNLKEV